MRCVSLFDFTGNMLAPWRDAGYECHIYDIQHEPGTSERDGMILHGCDLLSAAPELPGECAFVCAFPPCDHLAVSGAAWFKGKGLRKLADSIHMFATAAEFCEASGAPYLIENPVSTISTYWREPNHTFQPFEFTGYWGGDNYTKKTCLWTGGGFRMPQPLRLDGLGNPDERIHRCPPGPNRKNFRSATPMGFAMAVFQANSEVATCSPTS